MLTTYTNIWWIEDHLSKKCIDGRYFSTKEEAVDRRNELGYGIVKKFEPNTAGVVVTE